MRQSRWAAAVLALLGPAACVTPRGVDEDLSRLRRNVVTLEQEVRDLKGVVARIEGQVTLLALHGRAGDSSAPVEPDDADSEGGLQEDSFRSARGSAPAARSPGARASRQGSGGVHQEDDRQGSGATSADQRRRAPGGSAAGAARSLPVVRLGGGSRAAETDDEQSYPAGALDVGQPPIVIKLGPTDGDRLSVNREVLARPDPVLGPGARRSPSAQGRDASVVPPRGASRGTVGQSANAAKSAARVDYEAALRLLRVEDDPQGALSAFLAFQRKHPGSELAANVAYWVGECYYALESYKDAIAQFAKLSRDFPRSSKVPYGLVTTAESWLKLGQASRSREVLRQVLESHPGTEAAHRARARILSLESPGAG